MEPIKISEVRSTRRSRDGDRWGHWVYRVPPSAPTNAAIVYENVSARLAAPGDLNEFYYVYMRDCVTSEQRQAWLAQLAEKRWITDEDLGRFVRALEAIMGLRGPRR